MNSAYAARVLAGVIAGLAAVQAAYAEGPVIYGQLNLSLDLLDNGAEAALNVSSNNSRLGVKGEIAAGDELAAIYQIESEINADTGNTSSNDTAFASRNTFAGLRASAGTLRIGRFDTPVKELGRAVDLFADQVGDARNLTRGAHSDARFDERVNNSVGYGSPRWRGVSTVLQYSTNTDNGAAADDHTNLISAGLRYTRDALFVGLGYERNGLSAASAGREPHIIRVGGYYDAARWRVAGLWQAISGTVPLQDETAYGAGVRYARKAWSFKTQVYRLDARSAGGGATLVAAGAEYALHKGVTLYADYAVVADGSAQKLSPYKEGRSDSLALSAPGETASAVSVGAIIRL